MIILCIIRDQTKARPEFHIQLLGVVTNMLQSYDIPVKNSKNPVENQMEYAYLMLVLDKYLLFFMQIVNMDNNVASNTFNLVMNILKNDKIHEAPLSIAYRMIETLTRLSN